MRKKIASWIYKWPIIRGLVRQIKEIRQSEQKNANAIKQNRQKNKENTLAIKRLEKQKVKIKGYIRDVRAEIRNSKAGLKDTRTEIQLLKEEIQSAVLQMQDLKRQNERMCIVEKNLKDEINRLNRRNIDLKNELMKEIEYKYCKALSPGQYKDGLKEWFLGKTGEKLNLDNPQTYNEKIQWLKLYDSTPEKTRLADKYLVRDYVKEKIGEQYLIPLLGVWDRPEDIDLEQLPNQCVLKVNHGAGWNIIVRDKNKTNWEMEKGKLDKWLKRNFAFCNGFELHYADIEPKIIAEEYIENDDDGIDDYKVFCFNGKAKYIMYLTEREKGLKMAFYDLEWNLMPFIYDFKPVEKTVEKPDNLNEMISLAEKLSKGFVQVRVDFYRLNDGSLKFGELTFTSCSGACKWDPPEYNKILGGMIDLRELQKLRQI